MIRRKTNRRHMTGDHHGQTATRQRCWSQPQMTFSARTAWRIPVAPHGQAYSWSTSGIAIAYEAEIRAYYPDGSHTSLGPGRQWSGCILSMYGNIPVAVTRDGQVTWLGTDDSPQVGFVAAHQGAGTAVTTSGSSVLSAGADGSIALTRRDGNGPPVIVSRLDRRLRCSGAKVKGLRRERERLAFQANRADATNLTYPPHGFLEYRGNRTRNEQIGVYSMPLLDC